MALSKGINRTKATPQQCIRTYKYVIYIASIIAEKKAYTTYIGILVLEMGQTKINRRYGYFEAQNL